jgi:hypothetical protein
MITTNKLSKPTAPVKIRTHTKGQQATYNQMDVIPPIHGSQRRTTNHIKQQIIPQTETNHIKQQAFPQAETKSPK